MTVRNHIKKHFQEGVSLKKLVIKKNLSQIVEAAHALIDTYWKYGGTVYLFGNGGSSCDAQHWAEELTSAFKIMDRWSLPAQALSANGPIITAIGNDYGFENIFSRQIEGVAKPGDLVIGISTSGNSENVTRAVRVARKRGIKTIGLLGKGGGKMALEVDIPIIISSDITAHIQECHIAIAHAICSVLEEMFFSEKGLSWK